MAGTSVTHRSQHPLRGLAVVAFGGLDLRTGLDLSKVGHSLLGEARLVVAELLAGLCGGNHAVADGIAAARLIVRRYEQLKLAMLARCEQRLCTPERESPTPTAV